VKKFVIGVFVCALVSACGSSPTAPENFAQIGGNWTGTFDSSNWNPIAVKVNLTQSAGSVTGTWAGPTDWNGTVDQTVSVQGVEGLKFSLASFDVKPGARVKLDFANTSDMLHNLVVVKPGAGTKVGEAALKLGLDGQKLDYVPKSDDVLFNTSLLEPQKVESIYFVAPTTPGEYQYVCTFPGHYVTMQGTMRVIR